MHVTDEDVRARSCPHKYRHRDRKQPPWNAEWRIADPAYAGNAGDDPTNPLTADTVVVTAGATITYCAPAREGDVLLAERRRRAQQGRMSFFDVEISTPDGTLIAVAHGQMVRRPL